MKRYLVFLLVLIASVQLRAQVPTTINVEIDWMVDTNPTTAHSHKPTQAEINAAIQMFACQGITLNVVMDDTVKHIYALKMDPTNCPAKRFFDYTGADSYGAIKAANFSRGPGWHYCIFAHRYEDSCGRASGSSGLADAVGNFVVTLGGFPDSVGTAWDRAATFVHELGHNLGLSHSGNMGGVAGNFAPSVPSVMTYFSQLAGVKSNLECQGLLIPGLHLFKNLDYSHGITCALNENALNESRGNGIRSVDWNCSGTISGTVVRDISNNDSLGGGLCSSTTGTRTTLTDYDEWANIRDRTFENPESPLIKEESKIVYSCISYEEHQRYISNRALCPQPSVTSEPCITNTMKFVAAGPFPIPAPGSCTFPIITLTAAQAVASAGDVLFLAPGSYVEPGIVLNKRLIITGPGGIIIGQ